MILPNILDHLINTMGPMIGLTTTPQYTGYYWIDLDSLTPENHQPRGVERNQSSLRLAGSASRRLAQCDTRTSWRGQFWGLSQNVERQTVNSALKHSFGLTLWLFNIAMENGSFIVDLPIKNGDFP